MAIPMDVNALLTRKQTAAALTEAGFPVAEATLSTMATRGGGPPYRKFGARPLYQWGQSLDWANGRLKTPVRSTSEMDFKRQEDQRAREPIVSRFPRPQQEGPPNPNVSEQVNRPRTSGPAGCGQASSPIKSRKRNPQQKSTNRVPS
jgi:hypothetical protein